MAERERQSMSSRWWEYYFVRYFVGTVIGAGAIVFMVQFPSSPLRTLGLPSLKELKDVGIIDLTTIAALGLAYCYVASAPILTLHAVRAQLDLVKMRISWRFWGGTALGIAGVCAIAANALSLPWWSRPFLSVVFFCIVVGVQIALIIAAHTNRFTKIEQFYWKLTGNRSSGALRVSEYVESYRHLREHGNAFAILVLEVGLAIVLVSAPTHRWLVLLLLVWALPASYCWVIGTVLEARLSHAPKE